MPWLVRAFSELALALWKLALTHELASLLLMVAVVLGLELGLLLLAEQSELVVAEVLGP